MKHTKGHQYIQGPKQVWSYKGCPADWYEEALDIETDNDDFEPVEKSFYILSCIPPSSHNTYSMILAHFRNLESLKLHRFTLPLCVRGDIGRAVEEND